MTWKAPDRNFGNIQFAELRKLVDGKFNQVHDELSECYYNEKPFRTFGILTKEKFDKLHGLIFALRNIVFHRENLKQLSAERIPESEYNEIRDASNTLVGKKTDLALNRINELKAEGIELVI